MVRCRLVLATTRDVRHPTFTPRAEAFNETRHDVSLDALVKIQLPGTENELAGPAMRVKPRKSVREIDDRFFHTEARKDELRSIQNPADASWRSGLNAIEDVPNANVIANAQIGVARQLPKIFIPRDWHSTLINMQLRRVRRQLLC